MTDKQRKIIIGGLLHDVGKILYRYDDGRSHGESGYDFLKNEAKIEDKEILDQVRFHHASSLKAASVSSNSLAYITYIADNIAARMDRRKKAEGERGFVKDQPLESVFNILNGNQGNASYTPMFLDVQNKINYPTEDAVFYSESFYAGVKQKLMVCLNHFEYVDEYINSLLEVLEICFTYVPSSTSKEEVADISLFDHVKMTAAIGSCIYQYVKAAGMTDYKTEFFTHSKQFYAQNIFLLYSMDISGIQSFIYTINSKGALKGLRSRSFYLEIMMEHLIDELLNRTELSRVNLIYSGGGHAYLLFPNTERIKTIIHEYEQEMNQWFLDYFDISLYIAGGMAECSSNSLCNEPEGSYKEIFQTISKSISNKKWCRYTPKQMIQLNKRKIVSGERECRICRRSDQLKKEDQCEICWALEQMSKGILYEAFFSVLKKKEEKALPLPGGYWLVSDDRKKVTDRMREDDSYVRTYAKNESYIGYYVETKLWVGNYINGETFEDLAKAATGVKKIAVMRADVDNLGKAFVSGFENKKMGNQYVTLSRTSTFSRKLSMFFKYHINSILENGVYSFTTNTTEVKKRNIVIVYSGGDDVFVVGSWDDVIAFSVDLYHSLKEFTQGTLTISAGIGLYPAKFPISVMASQVGDLEDASKKREGKNAITLFHKDYTFYWEDFIGCVIQEKLALLKEYFNEFDEKGMNFLYHMLEFIRNRKKDKINIARYAYLLGRVAPNQTNSQNKDLKRRKALYEHFSKLMYQWIKKDKDAKELEMAIYLYVYMMRKEEEKDERLYK